MKENLQSLIHRSTFPILSVNSSEKPIDFIKCWKHLFNYPSYESHYLSIISKDLLNEKDLEKLFYWKNGMMQLSGQKNQSFLQNILAHKQVVNELRSTFDYQIFEHYFSKISAIWQIFLMHIIQAETYPIFDQHVYRTYAYLQKKGKKELPFYNKAKLKIYKEEYLPFFNSISEAAGTIPKKEIDNALWAFGRFLKDYPTLIN